MAINNTKSNSEITRYTEKKREKKRYSQIIAYNKDKNKL